MAPNTTITSSQLPEQGTFKFTLNGCIKHPQYEIATECIKYFEKQHPTRLTSKTKFNPLFDLDYIEFLKTVKKGKNASELMFPNILLEVTEFNSTSSTSENLNLEMFQKWLKDHGCEYSPLKTELEYITKANLNFNAFLISSTSNPIVFMDITIDEMPAGKIYIEMFKDKCPLTVENFLKFSSLENGYKSSEFYRCVENGWMQAGVIRNEFGDILNEPTFANENFIVGHSRRGILSMVNHGPNTNFSAFMVCMAPMEYFDKKYVAFGRVVEGNGTLKNMEHVETRFERPKKAIVIKDVGLL